MCDADSEAEASTCRVALPGFEFDLQTDELRDSAGEVVALRPNCLAVLRELARNAGRVVDKEALIRAVWPNEAVSDDSLVQCIGELRRTLGDVDHRVVRTEHRRGYRLVASSAAGMQPATDGGAEQEVRFATSYDGVKIAYVCGGSGVPVVRAAPGTSHLGHDMACLTEGPILRAVQNRHRLVRYDRRSQGLSDRHVTSFTLEDSVRDLLAVVDTEGVSRFVLWSMGCGPTAIRFAAQYPERVERLILCGCMARGVAERSDGVWGNTGPSGERFVEALWQDESSTIRSGGGPGALSRVYPTGTPEQVRSFDRLQMLACTGEGALAVWRAAKYWNVVADLEHVQCPTLVLHSQRNRTILLEEAELIAARVADARLVILDTDNWMPLAQEPAFDEMVSEMSAFIAECEFARAFPARAGATTRIGNG